MRSIRLSLVVYFLGLLGAALGMASLLVYESARQTLREKQKTTAKLIDAKFEKHRDEEHNKLDEALLVQAKSLARRVQVQIHHSRLWFRDFHIVGAVTAQATPNGFALVPLWLAQGVRSRVSYDIFRRNVADIKLPRQPRSELHLPADGAVADYFQIDSNYWGRPLRSRSLGTRFLPDMQDFAPEALLHWEPDDYLFDSSRVLRRVRLKVASASQVSIWPRQFLRPQPRGDRRGPSRRTSSDGKHFEYPALAVFVQCLADTSDRDAAIARLSAARDEERQRLREDTEQALLRQRNRLLAIASVTFAATVVGTCWLVWLGLLPLRRLSDAVSQVSPRDFRLPLDEAALPVELRPITARLATTLEQLKRAFAREKQATADISHELRTPLAAMLTTLELALRKQRSPEQYRELLHDCQQSAQQINQIVERLLTLARLDAGVDRLRPQPVDVAELVEQCATIVRPLAEARGLHLIVHNECSAWTLPEEHSARLTTDPDKLREVLNNLLHNAIQYNRPDGRIDLVLARQKGRVQVEVRDTGIGIAPESRDLIFERFYRGDPSRTGDGMNAGLGLAIVKEYVELMGGHISVESAPGEGSTFRVELPVPGPASAA